MRRMAGGGRGCQHCSARPDWGSSRVKLAIDCNYSLLARLFPEGGGRSAGLNKNLKIDEDKSWNAFQSLRLHRDIQWNWSVGLDGYFGVIKRK